MKRLLPMLTVIAIAGCGARDDTAPVTTTAQAIHQLDRAFTGAPENFRKAATDASNALNTGDLGKAVESLGALRSSEGVSVDQGLAVHNTMVMLESTLLEKAESGDAEARRAYALLKRLKQK